jgi:transcriptional repressor NrdR
MLCTGISTGEGGWSWKMRCPYCRALEDRVIDSRTAEDGAAIRRRRECEACGQRFTTFERAEPVSLIVMKRSGEQVPYSREKIVSGIRKACVNRPVTEEEIQGVADQVQEVVRAASSGPVPSQEIGLAVLDRLRALDEVAYLRFASVYKDFQAVTDFEAELGSLLAKGLPPKGKEQKG